MQSRATNLRFVPNTYSLALLRQKISEKYFILS